MTRLTAAALEGIWAGLTLPWDDSFRLEEDVYARNAARLIEAGAHGIYTTGSTGEFYALEFGEFRAMVDIVADGCGHSGTPLQVGCCSDATAKTLRLLEYAAGKPAVGAVQVTLPYWMELTDREVLAFFDALYRACPDLPLVHYNIPRAKRFLTGPDYLRLLEVAPNLIGVKFTFAGGHFAQLQDAIALTPGLSYFVAENLLASAMQLGARGCYSSLVCTQPAFMLALYGEAAAGRWPAAIARQLQVAAFFRDLEAFLAQRQEGDIDPVADKGLAVASGCLGGHQRCRPPYIGWSDETVRACRAWLEANYPQFVHP